MIDEHEKTKIVIFTGSGISAESGLDTFNDQTGLWMNHRIEDVATPTAWHRHPQEVLAFYNELRMKACNSQPNAAHLAIAQSIDGLRESLRSDHPLQGETLDGVRDALQAIADNIGDARR